MATPRAKQDTFSTKKSIWGPVTRNGVSQFPIYRDLGLGIYEIALNWAAVAPTRPAHAGDPSDPAYHWPADLVTAVRQAPRYGIRVAVQVTGAPQWANGNHALEWAPRNPSDYAQFAAATSRKFPSINLWMIWGEPDRKADFQPEISERRDHPLNSRQAQAPRLYARLLDAAYGALKRVSRYNRVIGGMTFVTGDISPLNWIKNMRLPNGRPPRMDLYGHNPFSNREPNVSNPPLVHNFIDMSNLSLLEGWIDRYLSRGGRRLELFLSEFFLPTDHPNSEFNFWVSRDIAARWLAAALRIANADPRIYTLGWFGLYDDQPTPKHDEVDRGLLTYQGQKKPAYDVFKNG